jgi:uncharacterized CHY-type Zn-finger protein
LQTCTNTHSAYELRRNQHIIGKWRNVESRCLGPFQHNKVKICQRVRRMLTTNQYNAVHICQVAFPAMTPHCQESKVRQRCVLCSIHQWQADGCDCNYGNHKHFLANALLQDVVGDWAHVVLEAIVGKYPPFSFLFFFSEVCQLTR